MNTSFLKEKRKLILAISIICLLFCLASIVVIPCFEYNYLRLGYGLNLIFALAFQFFFFFPLISRCYERELSEKIERFLRIGGTISLVLFFLILIYLERYLDKDLSNITSSSETLLNNSVFIFLAGIVATIKITSIIFARKGLLSKRYEIFSYIGTVVLVIISLASILTLDNVANDFTSPISFLYIPNVIFFIGYGLGQIGMINNKKIKCLLPLVFISFIGFAIIGFLI